MKATTQVKKWGNSLAIRIPAHVARNLGLSDNSQVEITSDGVIAIIKREKNSDLELNQLVKAITPDNLHSEADWGGSVGKEIW